MIINATFVLAMLLAFADDYIPVIHPEVVEKCLKDEAAKGAEVDTATNPYYLRGDFDGDGRADYAVAVRGAKNKRMGVLVCLASGTAYALGGPNEEKFSDFRDDNFFAPNWTALSKAETMELRKYPEVAPHPLPRIRAETIEMVWEDGLALIYWDGKRFRWARWRGRQSLVVAGPDGRRLGLA